ncbi:uncharacterized protein LOC123201162 [Mangifera indica]|uniref:uncharacterized protein LOC123201162 n=1 Tax=Mangifera indica TaxID=29780 RepID=UPI001CFBE535|nr:uncharacterized protein LOC123201162 [Mangifera indica]
MNKGLWLAKGPGHIAEGDAAFNNHSSIDSKRPHQWFVSTGDAELFPNKKQATQAPNNKSSAEISNANVSYWGNTSSFPSVPNQLVDRLFGSESSRSISFSERNLSPVGTDDMRRKVIEEHFGEDASAGLSMSHAMEDSETFSYGGYRKVKVNDVKDSNNGLHPPKEHSLDIDSNNDLSTAHTYNKDSQSSYMTMGQAYNKEDDNVTLMGHTYSRDDVHIRSTGPGYGKVDNGAISFSDTYRKEDANIISFVGFDDEHNIVPVGQPISGYGPLYSSVQTSEAVSGKQLNASNMNAAVAGVPQVAKSKPESVSKNKPELKCPRKEAPNSFPSNVRSLISTGMLDGVPVKYVSLSQEELCGIIKGSGYLCGCQSCNYSKVLNAYEFERHAGCKTKHPNNHIYFENGKTIYQIVQELRSTPESLLFDTIQTVFGAPINQKSFRIWKESFQAATRELQRIYGKEELNL